MFLHMFLKIRFVKFASSQGLPEPRAGTALKREETVIIMHQNLVMR